MLKFLAGCISGSLIVLLFWVLNSEDMLSRNQILDSGVNLTAISASTESKKKSHNLSNQTHTNSLPFEKRSEQTNRSTPTPNPSPKQTQVTDGGTKQYAESDCIIIDNRQHSDKPPSNSIPVPIFEPYATILGRSGKKLNVKPSNCIAKVVKAHSRLESEMKDSTWAGHMETFYRDFLLGHTIASAYFKINVIECRTTLCELQLEYEGISSNMSAKFLQSAWHEIRREMTQQYWWNEIGSSNDAVLAQRVYQDDKQVFNVLSIDTRRHTYLDSFNG